MGIKKDNRLIPFAKQKLTVPPKSKINFSGQTIVCGYVNIGYKKILLHQGALTDALTEQDYLSVFCFAVAKVGSIFDTTKYFNNFFREIRG